MIELLVILMWCVLAFFYWTMLVSASKADKQVENIMKGFMDGENSRIL